MFRSSIIPWEYGEWHTKSYLSLMLMDCWILHKKQLLSFYLLCRTLKVWGYLATTLLRVPSSKNKTWFKFYKRNFNYSLNYFKICIWLPFQNILHNCRSFLYLLTSCYFQTVVYQFLFQSDVYSEICFVHCSLFSSNTMVLFILKYTLKCEIFVSFTHREPCTWMLKIETIVYW